MSTMKLQKLVYYSQAWHLAWTNRALFDDQIEAWANGPVTVSLYRHHRGEFEVAVWPLGDSGRLSTSESAVVKTVVETYGPLSSRVLSDQTHREDPWRLARGPSKAGERSDAQISPVVMRDYYQSIPRTAS
ncbi:MULTISPECIES: Panacea domain-containing protein [unclassified Rhodococcus (in: high G+C Gram-positive bacteria)]|uniref:Panacea domain-containing protein n=1 Tax=unclassified Rhodococcus (in: high G+C Gram-positive bacteria) TaxID=192944 RepID=UPI0035942A4E